MLLSNNQDMIEKARFWATQSRDQAKHYQHSEIGYNYRMSNVSAGIGRGQLTVLPLRVEQKKNIYNTYLKAFEAIEDIEMMPISPKGEPNYWLSTMTLKQGSKVKPDDIMDALEKENIECRPIWKPMHLQPIFAKYDYFSHCDGEESISDDIFNRGLCLPSDVKMSEVDMERIVGIVKRLFE